MPRYPVTPCRMIHEIGKRYTASFMWPEDPAQHLKQGGPLHSVSLSITPADWEAGLETIIARHRDALFALRCACCGGVPVEHPGYPGGFSAGSHPVYDTPDGERHPGDMWLSPCWGGDHCAQWDNCSGQHLYVILPNGHIWDVDSRCSNCTLPNDRTHRCWIRTGEPPNVTAGKSGHTCSAGAGSIKSGDYHGFLRGGVLTAG